MKWAADEMDRVAQLEALAYAATDSAKMVEHIVRLILDDLERVEHSDLMLARVRSSITFEKRWDEPDGYKWARAVVILTEAGRRAWA